MNQLSEKQLSFEGAMKIVNGNKWIKLKDIEKLSDFIQEQQATIEDKERRIMILENLLTRIGVQWVDDDE